MFTRKSSAAAGYLFTILAVALATLLRFALMPVLGLEAPFILHFPTIVLSAWLGGLGTGLLATALGGLIAWYALIPLQYSFHASGPAVPAELIIFALAGTLISLLGESLHRARRRSEEHLTRILEGISDGFQSIDADRRYSYVNSAIKRMWAEQGANKDVIGQRLFDVFPKMRETELGRALTRAMTERVPLEIEAFSPLFERWYANRYFPTPEGGLLIFTQDISARKKTEETLRGTMEQLRLVTDIMAAPVTRCSRDFRYLWVSKTYADWLGLTPGEISGRPIEEVIGKEAYAHLHPHFERVLAGEEVRYEERVNFQGIGERWISAVYTPTLDAAGLPDGWVAVVIDIDNRKQAEEALKEASRRKDEFLALLSHELRNPLAGISNALHLLRRPQPSAAATTRALDVMERQTRQMKRLIDDLLEVTRMTRGKIALQSERLDLVALVRATVEDHRGMLDQARLALRLDLPPEPLWVEGDRARLAQMLGNLLANAAKFTREGGEVSVEVSSEVSGETSGETSGKTSGETWGETSGVMKGEVKGEAESRAGSGRWVAVTVRDTGIGIEPEAVSRLFEPFVQIERGLARSEGGLGLGLALVKGLAELHGGEARAQSEGEGKGAAFTLLLPAKREEEATAAAGATADADAAGAPALSILVIEDNRDSADMLCSVLGSAGHRVECAYSGPDGLSLAQRSRPEVVICDIGLPEMDGYEVAAALRRELPACYLVALSGYGRAADKRRALEAGFNHHLTKPVDFDELERLIMTRASAAG